MRRRRNDTPDANPLGRWLVARPPQEIPPVAPQEVVADPAQAAAGSEAAFPAIAAAAAKALHSPSLLW